MRHRSRPSSLARCTSVWGQRHSGHAYITPAATLVLLLSPLPPPEQRLLRRSPNGDVYMVVVLVYIRGLSHSDIRAGEGVRGGGHAGSQIKSNYFLEM